MSTATDFSSRLGLLSRGWTRLNAASSLSWTARSSRPSLASVYRNTSLRQSRGYSLFPQSNIPTHRNFVLVYRIRRCTWERREAEPDPWRVQTLCSRFLFDIPGANAADSAAWTTRMTASLFKLEALDWIYVYQISITYQYSSDVHLSLNLRVLID